MLTKVNRAAVMDWVSVESSWDHYRAMIKARWAKLSATDLDFIAGNRAQLASAIREVYKISGDEIERQIRYFEARNSDYRPESSSCSKWRRVLNSASNES